MLWDIEKIKDKYNILSSRDNLSYSERLSKGNYVDMINFHYGKVIHRYSIEYEKNIDKEKAIDRYDFVKRVLGPSALDISYVGYLHHMPDNFFYSKRVEEEEFIRLNRNFLLDYSLDSCELFDKFIEEKRIELRPYLFGSALGRCYQFDEEGSSYIRAFYDGKLKKSSVLLHEIAHAKSFEDVTDYDLSLSMRSSLFVEAIPKYYELLYASYLYSIGKYREGLRIESNIFNELIAILEVFLPELCSGRSLNLYRIPYIYCSYASLLLALKLYYVFKIDSKLALQYKDTLDSMIGINSDREIFNFFNLDGDKRFIEDLISDYRSRFFKGKSVIISKKD